MSKFGHVPAIAALSTAYLYLSPVLVAPHGRPLERLRHAELDAGVVAGDAHQAAQGIDFAHHLTLARPPIAGLRRHLWRCGSGSSVMSGSRSPQVRRRQAASAPRVATDHNDVVLTPHVLSRIAMPSPSLPPRHPKTRSSPRSKRIQRNSQLLPGIALARTDDRPARTAPPPRSMNEYENRAQPSLALVIAPQDGLDQPVNGLTSFALRASA